MCCGQPGYGHPRRRAGYIVQPHLVAVLNGQWMASMFATDADQQVRTALAAPLHGEVHQLADGVLREVGVCDAA